MSSGASPSQAVRLFREDEELVRECLLGSEEAWSDLIDKYGNLIYSIPVKFGFSGDDANEVFQAVWLTLLEEIPKLREPRALARWLMKITARKCACWKNEPRTFRDPEINQEHPAGTGKLPEDRILEEVEREQMLREAVAEMSPDCRRLIELILVADSTVRHDEAGDALGFATAPIEATRMRCLETLRSSLETRDFR